MLWEKIKERNNKCPSDAETVEDLMSYVAGVEDKSGDDFKNMIEVVRSAAASCMRLTDDSETFSRARIVLGEALRYKARWDVDTYFIRLEWNREPEKKFYMPRRKQLRPLIEGFQAILDDEIDFLTVSMPPGVGKTTGGIFFITMVMGLWPDDCNLASAHSDKLTKSIYTGVLSVLTDPEYAWGEIFPEVELVATSAKDETVDLHKVSRFPTFTARSIDGSLTGATRCGRLLYADDLVSGIEEALNVNRLNSLWDKYTTDLKTRKYGKHTKEIHVATRWSVHDPIGRLQNMYGDSDHARFIVMPALDKNDESNFDYAYGLGFTTAMYHDQRDSMDEVSWRCLYMNEPVEREGLVYHESELRRYYDLPKDPDGDQMTPDAIIAICDTKDKGSDYEFLPIGYVYGDDYYIEDCVCDNGMPGQVESKVVAALYDHKVQSCQFESNAAGGRIADSVNVELKKLGGITHITKRYTTSNKETKIIVNAQWVKDHCLFKDKTLYTRNGDYGRMMSMLCSYTQAGKNPHDDVPDGMAMFALFAQSLQARPVRPVRSPFQ